MKTFETMSQIETQICQLSRARAVLSEVENYFEITNEAKWLPFYANHILLLLHVTDGILCDMLPELEAAVGELIEHCRTENKEEQNESIN